MGTARLALLVAVVPLAVRAPNTYHRTEAVWGTLKRCAGGECDHFCWPGLPHMWAEMMLRMIEQSTYGFSDGLH